MKDTYWGPVMRILVNITAWIAGPVIIGSLIGRWLDKKFNTDPWLFLTAVGICFLVSMFGLTIMALKEFKKIDEEYKNKAKK